MKVRLLLIFLSSGILFTQCDKSPNYPEPEAKEPVVLPYPVGTGFMLWQGFNGEYSHYGDAAYAYDFGMSIGTVITAARSGTVFRTREIYHDSTTAVNEVNYILVDHGDGTLSRYLHLTQNGVLVEVGDEVSRGDTLGLSGDTGWSTAPHLHYDIITDDCYQVPWQGPCVTVYFKVANTYKEVLDPGYFYEAEPYPAFIPK